MADWDERYRRGEHASDKPHALLVRASETRSPGRALDVACGAGRHAIYLAEHGWDVVAVDSSSVAIALMCERAAARGVTVEARVADLERDEFVIEPDAYNLVCDLYYLQRNLFPHIRAGVRVGGTIIAAIYTVDDRPTVRPMNPAFLLQPGELRAEFQDWAVEHYDETSRHNDNCGEYARRTAEIIARKQ